ncbi:1,4-alpha-glucan (glycogen) branching enzyme, GH-13-type [Arcticibacter svalbardensis MN12-7]|uniref:1,4-alpha-glucan branching enzyme GlgB n=1 Tax=Arcticibacter svalbardensis MN12-7 TaxID=1150600 RepID=R9GZY7_9SPHI|nr:1,4-alpha-glucan branching protein GlgB [Arcticibacter svalbardensis]EOR94549.1 1,4-alpha-glucan (glycogen) branching enzyme, GH-13-type [Arcticibacter svalbardensis MN12-7]
MPDILQSIPFSLFTDFDVALFKAGKHYNLYNKLGSHLVNHEGEKGTYFAVWAPAASYVTVVGNFNSWDKNSHPMHVRWDGSGIWELFIPGVLHAEYYKYYIENPNGFKVEKGDPYALHWETPPHTSSITWDQAYTWNDAKWVTERQKENALSKPISVYEVHLGSWRRSTEDGSFLTYREIAAQLPDYCVYMGFTHVEFMPIMEHPFYGSWGYQVTGYFAPSSRFGAPEDFKFLVDQLHLAGIGVILDWVPSHFPVDEHGLGYFDGSHLYEYADPRKGFHPDWKSFIFNLDRNEVREFLISNAFFWLEQFHIDGLRVDAVASMLYLDYSREEGEWIPNQYGGRENLEAISFLRELNTAVHESFPDVITVAEESTSWPGVTHPVHEGGLGFDMKWMMGWMHDTLHYFENDPVYRKYHQGQITFSLLYAFTEKFTLPLSHDEVVYGKQSLLNKMPGDEWQKFANLRLLFAYMYGHPGAKLIFMGGEFAQSHEWQHDFSLDWHENHHPLNNGVQSLVKDLNMLYHEPALYTYNFTYEGFEWIANNDDQNCVICWRRKGINIEEDLIFVANFTPVVRSNYRIGVSLRGFYKEILNSDSLKYGGSDVLNSGELDAFPIPAHDQTHSLSLTLPPLGVIVLKFSHAEE